MFTGSRIKNKRAIFTLTLAFILGFITLGLNFTNLWYSYSAAAIILALLAIIFGGKPLSLKEINFKAIIKGIFLAIILYGLFWFGTLGASKLFNFAPVQIDSIYDLLTRQKLWIISCILLFVTGPAEEIFWRGFLQRWLRQHVKKEAALVLSALFYGGIYIFSGNIMLFLGAFAAGLFWGYFYIVEKSIVPLIISHSLWTFMIIVLYPLI
ncbi:MAG: CPBP family intramembrane metalloprotease [Clostridiales bacterium]|nr:CPBP family intramembrane metalloprotease [Clostridiales bacterium]MCF8023129.1 CPBP family intramembrane metalloprotease [Clostridiales bacterium]